MTRPGAVRLLLSVLGAAAAVLMLTSGPGQRRPAPHVSLHVDAGRLGLRAVRSGHGMPVILLHGYGESLIAWRGLFDRLAAHADVVALDLPGFGLSDKPPNGYGTEQLAETVLAAASALGIDSLVIVGHSMGGTVAVAAGRIAPHRVRGLVLLAPAGAAAPPLLPDSSDAVSATARAIIAEYENQRSRFTSVHDPAWLAETAERSAYLPADDPAYRAALATLLREFDFTYLSAARLRDVRQPVVLVWGVLDQVVPLAQAESLRSRLPDARLVIVPRAWHRPHVERPAETAEAVLAFLAGLSARPSP